jgi:hypothetical protein
MIGVSRLVAGLRPHVRPLDLAGMRSDFQGNDEA